jgi:hypothetical protein
MSRPQDATAASAPAVERKLYRYPKCDGWVYRWFIVGDAVPRAFHTEREAVEALAARNDRRQA